MKELFVDNALRYENSFSGILEKMKFLINKFCSNKKINISTFIQLKIERDCIVHRNGKYDSRDVQLLGNKVNAGDYVVLNEGKIKKYIVDCLFIINFFEENLCEYYINNFVVSG